MTTIKKSIEIEKERLSYVQLDNIATLYKCNVMLNELEQDLLIHIISKIKNWGKQGEYSRITFNANNFLRITNRNTNTFDNIRKALEHLTNLPIKIGDYDNGHWLSWMTEKPKTSDFTVDIPEQIRSFLGYIEGLYVKFNADYVYRLIGSYSKKIYMMLKAALKGKQSESLKIELAELRELLSLGDKYQLYGHLKQRVLLAAKNEINKKTDIEISIEEIKNGHAVSQIEFIIFNNVENKIDNSEENIIRNVLKQRGFFDKTIDAFIKYSHCDVEIIQRWENKANEIFAKNQSENEIENDEELKNTILLEIAELNKKTEAEPKPKKEKNNETNVVYDFLKDGGFSNKMIDEYVKLSGNSIEIMQNWFNYATIYMDKKNITVKNIRDSIYLRTAQENWPEKQTELKKEDSKYSYTKEKELEKQKQQNKTVPVDEPILVVDTIPNKTEFDEELDKNFKRKLLKDFDNIRIEDFILENKIHFYLDTTDENNLKVKVYFPESSIQYFIDNRIEVRLNNILNPRQTAGDIEAGKKPENGIIPKPFATDGVNQLIYKVVLIGVKK